MTKIKFKNGTDWQDFALELYPVGSVYISYVNTSPATLFGGTWSQIVDKVLRMANDTNTGGADSFTITSANLPKHTHSVGAHAHGLNSHTHTLSSHTHSYSKANTPTGGTSISIANLPKNYASFTVRKAHNGSNTYLAGAFTGWTENCNAGENSTVTDIGSNFATLDFYTDSSRNRAGSKITLTGSGTAHSHTIGFTATASAGPSNNTSGAASGNTANSTAFNTSDGGFSNTAISNLPAYQNLYAWRRTA